jgi:hypothetical protein
VLEPSIIPALIVWSPAAVDSSVTGDFIAVDEAEDVSVDENKRGVEQK